MRNILVKTAVTAVCLYTAAKWAKKHIRAGVIIGSPNITSAEIKELINTARENCTSLLVADESAFVNGNQKNQTYVFIFLDK